MPIDGDVLNQQINEQIDLTQDMLNQDSEKTAEENEEAMDFLEKFWLNELTRATKVRNQKAQTWRASRRAYMNKHNRIYRVSPNSSATIAVDGDEFYDPTGNPIRVSNPIWYSTVQIVVSNIMATIPVLRFTSLGDWTDFGKWLERLYQARVKQLITDTNMEETLRSWVYDAAIFGLGIAKSGYSFEGTFMRTVQPDSAYAVRISPFLYLNDPECTHQDNARWEAEERFLTTSELKDKKNNYFNVEKALELASKYVVNTEINKDDSTATPEGRIEAALDNQDANITTDASGRVTPADINRVKIFEVWDKVNKEILFFASNGSKLVLIFKEAFPKCVKYSPYTILYLNYVPDFFYPFSDYEIIEPKLREIDKIEQRILEYTRCMIPKGLVDKSAIESGDVENLVRAEMAKVIGVNGKSTPLSQIYFPLPMAALPVENFNMLQTLKREIDESLGITEYQRGNQQADRTTATEASIIDSASKTRSSLRQGLLDSALSILFQKIYDAMLECQRPETWVDVPGRYPVLGIDAEGDLTMLKDSNGNIVLEEQPGFKFSKELLRPFKITVEKGSTSASRSVQEQQLSMNLYATTGNDPMANHGELLKNVYDSFNLDPEKMMISQPQVQMPPTSVPGGPPSTVAPVAGGAANAPTAPTLGAEQGELLRQAMPKIDAQGISGISQT